MNVNLLNAVVLAGLLVASTTAPVRAETAGETIDRFEAADPKQTSRGTSGECRGWRRRRIATRQA
jgi:hypothetical protein